GAGGADADHGDLTLVLVELAQRLPVERTGGLQVMRLLEAGDGVLGPGAQPAVHLEGAALLVERLLRAHHLLVVRLHASPMALAALAAAALAHVHLAGIGLAGAVLAHAGRAGVHAAAAGRRRRGGRGRLALAHAGRRVRRVLVLGVAGARREGG